MVDFKVDDKAVEEEITRLKQIFKNAPKDRLEVIDGLIIQASRLRVMLDYMWLDIQKNGDYAMFSQSDKTEPYERERPIARLYNTRDQSYQRVIKMLADLIPGTEVETIKRRELLD